ncbi:MAG: winged helix-turn-helix domain-containing protein [Pseudomonadales bacterium]|nr:winged helix-turn-helix domain-containing protein [Pseudomonadales bacterium]MDG1441230.1 winged helix-turn-helix domain-containing protein [Pseudomonadales bacterium]
MTQSSIQFGEFQIFADRNEISNTECTKALPKQTMDVLVYLINNRTRVVPAGELLNELWNGRVVEESTIHRQISYIRSVLGDSAKKPQYIRTVSKRGYQAIAAQPFLNEANAPDKNISAAHQYRYFAIVMVALLLVVVTLLYEPENELSLPERSIPNLYSLAVLPLTNLTGDPNATISIGFADELLSRLSEDRKLKVVARAESTRISNPDLSMFEIAAQLQVHYLIEGSVQQFGDQIRITTQLIRAQDSFHVWSNDQNTTDGDLDRQAEIAAATALTLRTRLDEDIRRTHSNLFDIFDGVDPKAINLYLDSTEEYNAYTLGENGDRLLAMRLMEQATEVDPNFDAAELDMVWNYAHRVDSDLSIEESTKRAYAALARISEKNSDSAGALFNLAQVYLLLDLNYELASKTIHRGLELHPTGPWWNYYLSVIARREGRMMDALNFLELSQSREYGSESANYLTVYASALMDVGQHEKANAVADKVIAINSGGIPRAHGLLIKSSALIGMGKRDQIVPLINEAWQIAGGRLPALFTRFFVETGQTERAKQTLGKDNLKEGLRAFIAEGLLSLGEDEEAFALLAEGIEVHDSSVLDYLRSSPSLVALAPDPRYQKLIRRLESLETKTRR